MWQEYMSDVYYPIEVVAKSPETFMGSIVAINLKNVGISRFSANAQRATRHKSVGQLSAPGDFAVVFPTRGRAYFEQRGLEGEVSPGEFVVLNSEEQYTMVVPDQSQNLTLKIPSSCLRDLYPTIDSTCARRFIGNSRFVSIVAQVALESFQLSSDSSPEKVLHLESSLLDLVYLMLDAHEKTCETNIQSLSDFVFHELMSFIAHNFQDPQVTPELAAKRRGISVRYVHKIFRSHDTTFCNELLSHRLRHAHKLLSDRRDGCSSMRSIAEIAYACGFSSQSHFTMRFKDAYGYTPRAVT